MGAHMQLWMDDRMLRGSKQRCSCLTGTEHAPEHEHVGDCTEDSLTTQLHDFSDNIGDTASLKASISIGIFGDIDAQLP